MTPPASLQAASRTIYSLFRVLFNFPSRYLFTIGLVPVFSLGWSLPPTLDCILKQSDSKTHPSENHSLCCKSTRTGLSPSLGQIQYHNRSWISSRRMAPEARLNTTLPCPQTQIGFGAGLISVHSPLLGESWLVSFPPLTDMLKFSG